MFDYNSFDVNYYKQCIDNYDELRAYNTKILKNEITIEKIKKFENDREYNNIIEEIIKNLKNTEKKKFIPNVSERYTMPINNISINKLLKKIIPYFEKIYNCYLKIIDLKILKHFKGNHKEGAFVWHYDNHRRTIINVIIYLNDVEKNYGGMEYLTIDNIVVKKEFTRPAGNRNMENFVRNNPCRINQVLGEKSTIFYFDNNIIHRAGTSLTNEREAIILQLYPSLNKIY